LIEIIAVRVHERWMSKCNKSKTKCWLEEILFTVLKCTHFNFFAQLISRLNPFPNRKSFKVVLALIHLWLNIYAKKIASVIILTLK